MATLLYSTHWLHNIGNHSPEFFRWWLGQMNLQFRSRKKFNLLKERERDKCDRIIIEMDRIWRNERTERLIVVVPNQSVAIFVLVIMYVRCGCVCLYVRNISSGNHSSSWFQVNLFSSISKRFFPIFFLYIYE